MFKRVKSKPNQRARPSSPEADESTEATQSPSSLATKLKKKSRTASRLSFGSTDEEGDSETFKVKKSNLSYKLNASLNLDQTPNQRPTYDQAYLNELKASTPSARPTVVRNADVSYDADVSMLDIADESIDSIPSESSIQVAKERRKRLQNTGTENDYISLSLAVRAKDDQGPHPESRLVREEDELGEGDDEYAEYTSAQERIALGKKSMKKEAAKRRDEMKEMIQDAEEDEETTEWENEQLRRGGHRTPEPTNVKPVYKPTPIPAATPIPTLGSALSRLTQQLAQLTTSHATNTTALSSLAVERTEVDEREKEMREMVDKAEEKRAWFVSFKDWLESVASFLDEKYPLLENLEEEYLSLLKERHDMISARRRADDEDDLSTVLGITADIPDPATQKAERRAARVERRRVRQKQQNDEEGFSTDSELAAPDEVAYRSALSNLAFKKKEILADVQAEEFRDPSKGRWNAWRERYSDSYVGAWGGLGAVSVWEFWARLECLDWDCIENKKSLDSFQWYRGLYDFSHPDGEGQELGPDGDLVSSMISTAIIPHLVKVLDAGALDVYSGKHVKRVVDLVEEVEASMDSNKAKLQMLLKSIVSAFDKSISETETLIEKNLTISRPSPFDPAMIPARKRFLARQMKLLGNLLKWRKFNDERFGVGILVNRLVDACILRIADGGWDVGGQDVVRQVSAMLPPELVSSSIKNRLTR